MKRESRIKSESRLQFVSYHHQIQKSSSNPCESLRLETRMKMFARLQAGLGVGVMLALVSISSRDRKHTRVITSRSEHDADTGLSSFFLCALRPVWHNAMITCPPGPRHVSILTASPHSCFQPSLLLFLSGFPFLLSFLPFSAPLL